MKKKGKIQNHVAFFLVLSLGILSLVAGILGRRNAAEYRASCTGTTSAEVVRTETKTVESRRSQHKEYRAELKIEGRTGTVITEWSNKKYNDGSTVKVKYDPSNPDNIYVPSNPPYAERKARSEINMGILVLVMAASLFYISHMPKKEAPQNAGNYPYTPQ